MYQFHYNSLWAYLPPCFAVCIRRHKNEYAMLRTAHPFLWVNLSILSNFNNIFLHSLRWWRYTQVLSRALDDMQSVANALLALYGVRGTTQGDIDQANRTRAFSLSEGGLGGVRGEELEPRGSRPAGGGSCAAASCNCP